MGSPSDLFLRVYDAKGAKIAEVEDTGTSEAFFAWSVPADGTFRLMVEDLHRRGGPDHAYRLEVEAFEPSFSLAVTQVDKKTEFLDTFQVPQGGVLRVRVEASRRE